MTKPKNPYQYDCFDTRYQCFDEGYRAGLHDGEKRLARALRRHINDWLGDVAWQMETQWLRDWLTARLKGKK